MVSVRHQFVPEGVGAETEPGGRVPTPLSVPRRSAGKTGRTTVSTTETLDSLSGKEIRLTEYAACAG